MSIFDAALKTYEFWRDRQDGKIWAVELADGIVVGCCGPLHHKEVDEAFLHMFDYTPDGAGRIETGRNNFDMVDPALFADAAHSGERGRATTSQAQATARYEPASLAGRAGIL